MHKISTYGAGALLLLLSYACPRVGARALSVDPASKPVDVAVSLEFVSRLARRGEPPNKRRKGNEGDAHAIDDRDIVGLDADGDWGIQPSDLSGSDQDSEDGEWTLWTPVQLETAWRNALRQGQLIKVWLDKYASASLSRLDDLGIPRPDTQKTYEESYVDAFEANVELKDTWGDINRPFALSGTTVKDDGSWTDHVITSLLGSKFRPVAQVGSSVSQHAFITFTMEADDDINPPEQRLRSSEIQYQAWVKDANVFREQPNLRREIKYWLQSSIINTETLAIMHEAHAKFPGQVDHSHDNDEGVIGSEFMQKGHGIWRPPRTNDPDDEVGKVWTRLLATPNLKVVMHALADHADELENNYPVEIHTFNFEQIIVVVLGPMPETVDVLGTNVATA